jgi:hypothetical protein
VRARGLTLRGNPLMETQVWGAGHRVLENVEAVTICTQYFPSVPSGDAWFGTEPKEENRGFGRTTARADRMTCPWEREPNEENEL